MSIAGIRRAGCRSSAPLLAPPTDDVAVVWISEAAARDLPHRPGADPAPALARRRGRGLRRWRLARLFAAVRRHRDQPRGLPAPRRRFPGDRPRALAAARPGGCGRRMAGAVDREIRARTRRRRRASQVEPVDLRPELCRHLRARSGGDADRPLRTRGDAGRQRLGCARARTRRRWPRSASLAAC
jgi:hypothetical protein